MGWGWGEGVWARHAARGREVRRESELQTARCVYFSESGPMRRALWGEHVRTLLATNGFN